MRKVIYSMSISLDGYISDRQGNFDWGRPDDELHQFHNDRVREIGVHLLGRRLYETMVYWETAEQDGPVHDEFARIWKDLPKIVFSKSLDTVVGNTKLLRDGVVDEVSRLKEEPGKDIAVGGPGLASALIEAGLVDEYQVFFNPVVLGGGTPYFPPVERQIDLELLESRTFSSRVVYVRYGRA